MHWTLWVAGWSSAAETSYGVIGGPATGGEEIYDDAGGWGTLVRYSWKVDSPYFWIRVSKLIVAHAYSSELPPGNVQCLKTQLFWGTLTLMWVMIVFTFTHRLQHKDTLKIHSLFYLHFPGVHSVIPQRKNIAFLIVCFYSVSQFDGERPVLPVHNQQQVTNTCDHWPTALFSWFWKNAQHWINANTILCFYLVYSSGTYSAVLDWVSLSLLAFAVFP